MPPQTRSDISEPSVTSHVMMKEFEKFGFDSPVSDRYQGQWRRRGRGALDAGTEIPLQPMVKDHGEAGVPLQPMENNRDSEIHLQPMEGMGMQRSTMLEQVHV
ncbi:hypothetical protein DUI87_15853 [Hirundo rustica rustica]|uniref:Uncharacterized protein n=1 Tax=Hirundo rustica rustica TaxID=333673 RepID=A0A3M0JZL5_HIRRU|nr:hypothetical protein DUI87_15853 [Hirundo rustica rustica]